MLGRTSITTFNQSIRKNSKEPILRYPNVKNKNLKFKNVTEPDELDM
jgi:hypothetical protein